MIYEYKKWIIVEVKYEYGKNMNMLYRFWSLGCNDLNYVVKKFKWNIKISSFLFCICI